MNSRKEIKKVSKRLKIFSLYLLILLILISISFHVSTIIREDFEYDENVPHGGRHIDIKGEDIFIQEVGLESNPTILFVHGTGSWSYIWRDTMVELEGRGFRSIAMDLPPFGYSKRPEGSNYSTIDQANRINGVLDYLNVTDVTLVGHSFGSRAVMEANFLSSERVKAIILVDSALNFEVKSNEKSLIKLLLRIKPLRDLFISSTLTNPLFTKNFMSLMVLHPEDINDFQLNNLKRPLTIKDNSKSIGNWLPVFSFESTNNLLSSNLSNYNNIEVPTLLIWGRNDTLTPLSVGENLKENIPNSKLVVINETGHIPHIENNKEFNEILIEFLENNHLLQIYYSTYLGLFSR